MATLYRRNTGYWYVKFKDNGHWRYASTGKTDREEAAKVMADILAGLEGDTAAPTPSGPEPLSWEALDRRIASYGALHLAPATTARYRYALKAFNEHSGVAELAAVTPAAVDRFKRAQIEVGNGATTVNNYLRDLRVIAGRAIAEKWYDGENPFTAARLLPQPKRHPLWLDAAQIDLMLSEAEQRGRNCHLFVALGIYAGFRKSEAVEARWGWIDFGAGLIHIQRSETWGPKDSDERTLPLHDKLRALLERYRGRASAATFVLAPAKKVSGKWRYRYEPDTTFATACRHMGQTLVREAEERGESLEPAPDFSWITPHVLRHTFASQLVSAGVDLYKVSVWLGHADVKTTQIYAHLKPADRDINRF